jgi:MSHA pilin protein MshD
MRRRRSPLARGFSLVEAVISTLIAGLLLVAALGAVGAAKTTQLSIALRGRGTAMAQSLMNEVLALPYSDPNQTAAFGLETGEAGATRALYDDVDDFNGLDQTPPTTRDGSSLDSTGRWRRRVTVTWVEPTDFSFVRTAETGVKLIKVEVFYGSQAVVTLVSAKGQYS